MQTTNNIIPKNNENNNIVVASFFQNLLSQIKAGYYHAAIRRAKMCNICVIPANGKQPKMKWKTQEDREKAMQVEITDTCALFVLNFITLVDIDDPETLCKNYNITREELETIVNVKTRRGYHIFIPEILPSVSLNKETGIEVKHGNNFLCMFPGSVYYHEESKTHVKYEILNIKIHTLQTIDKRIRQAIIDTVKEKLIEIQKQKETEQQTHDNKEVKENNKEVKEKHYEDSKNEKIIDFEKLKELIESVYQEGDRQNIVIFTTAFLCKNGVSEEKVREFISEIIKHDEEKSMRLSGMEKTIEKYKNGEEIRGYDGLIKHISEEDLKTVIKKKEKYEPIGRGFFVRNDILYMMKKNENIITYQMVGPRIEVVSKIYDGKDITYEVKYKNNVDILKEIKDAEKIRKLSGLSIIKENKFFEWLNYEVQKCEKIKFIRKITGWHDDEFYHPLIQTDDVWDHWAFYKNIKKSKMNKQAQHELVKDALRDGKILGFIYVICTASIINNLIDTNPVVCFISGPSQSGKTTIAQLGVNLFLPAENIITTAYGTSTGIELLMKQLKDLPILFDECVLKDLDLEKIVFMVASRVGKIRGNKNLSINISELNSNCLFTSEILEPTQFKRAGAHRRLIAVMFEDFKEECFSKTKIQEIQKYRNLFGCGLDYIEFLKQNKNIVYKHENTINKHIDEANMYSIYHIAKSVLTTIKFLEDFYGEKFTELYKFAFHSIFKQKKEFEQKVNIVKKFVDDFTQYMARKQNQILDDINPEKKVYSELIAVKEFNYLYVISKIFNDFCNEHGFELKILLKELLKHKIIIPSNTGIRTIKKIYSIATSTYKIDLNKLNM